MSDLQQGMDCPWFSSYDKGVPHDIVIPEGGLQNILDTAAETYGQREAIVFQNTHISYRELKELAEKLGRFAPAARGQAGRSRFHHAPESPSDIHRILGCHEGRSGRRHDQPSLYGIRADASDQGFRRKTSHHP